MPERKKLPSTRFPNEISRYRRELGLTQLEFANVMGVGKETITSWECGYTIPRLPRLFEVSRQLNTLVENLYWPPYRPESPAAAEVRKLFPHRWGGHGPVRPRAQAQKQASVSS